VSFESSVVDLNVFISHGGTEDTEEDSGTPDHLSFSISVSPCLRESLFSHLPRRGDDLPAAGAMYPCVWKRMGSGLVRLCPASAQRASGFR